MVIKHYFDALEIRALAHQLVAIFGGKMPHMATLVPGGITEKVTSKKIALCRTKVRKLRDFIENTYLEDMLVVASEFPDHLEIGRGCGNFMSYGVFADPRSGGPPLFPAGVMIDGTLATVDIGKISEEVKFAKYSPDSGLHKTTPQPHKPGAYSWIKAPRYNGKPVEVGPLARIFIACQDPGANRLKQATEALLARTGLRLGQLDSALGRHFVRFIELQVICEKLEEWVEMLDPQQPTAVDFAVPEEGAGNGLTEAPRGALAHLMTIKGKKIDAYECVVPTTWNCSPQDDRDVPGPVEQSLLGTMVADANAPLEAARIVRSYDPCLACAVH